MIRICQVCGEDVRHFADKIRHINNSENPNMPYHSLDGTYWQCDYCGEYVQNGIWGTKYGGAYWCSEEHREKWFDRVFHRKYRITTDGGNR